MPGDGRVPPDHEDVVGSGGGGFEVATSEQGDGVVDGGVRGARAALRMGREGGAAKLGSDRIRGEFARRPEGQRRASASVARQRFCDEGRDVG